MNVRVRSVLLLCVSILTACSSTTHLGYESFVRDLDGKSELEISTYPAWFGSTKASVPYIYRHGETHDELFFQVFIRDKNGKIGPNPHVESILIESFSYQLDNQPMQRLLTDYNSNFWMQNNPNYEKRALAPVPYRANGSVKIEISLVLNGTHYAFAGEMQASESVYVLPLVLANP